VSKWKAIFALAAVGALVAGPSLAQTRSQDVQAPSGGAQSPSSTQKTNPEATGSTSDTQKPMGSTSDKSGSTTDKSTTDKSGSAMDKSTTDKSTSTMDKSGASDKGMKSDRQMGRMSHSQDESVKAVQQALKDKGHDAGPIDGVMGPHTMQALKEFQKAEGLKVTGRLDNQTREKLGVAAAASTPAQSPSGGSSSSSGSSPSGSMTKPSK
jgi:peptidoglycan hydrolase-like protein with peptidoglycan-binding domain